MLNFKIHQIKNSKAMKQKKRKDSTRVVSIGEVLHAMQTNDYNGVMIQRELVETNGSQDEQHPDCWFTGCPRIWTVGGLAPPDGWLAILQTKNNKTVLSMEVKRG